jgi:RNA polymerase sigma-70 factor, ECF subfamily
VTVTADSTASIPATDPELVRRMAGGDESAVSLLYDRHASQLLAVALRILGHRSDAEDVVQETFVYAWRRAGHYRADRSSVATWLILIARSRAIDRLRSAAVSQRTHQGAGRDAETHTSPEGIGNVLSRERRERVREELDRLPAEQVEVLVMAFFGGLSQTEIAAATGIPLGTVKTRTLLGMKKLRSALRAEIRELLG